MQTLILIGQYQVDAPKYLFNFTYNKNWDVLLIDLDGHFHLFVLTCIGDKQMKANHTWQIPMKVAETIGPFQFTAFMQLSQNELIGLFEQHCLHPFNRKTAIVYYNGISKIEKE